MQQPTQDSESFWRQQGQCLQWIKPYTRVKNTRFTTPVHIAWYEDGTLNASVNCIDRHLPQHADRIAYILENDDGTRIEHITYQQLHDHVCRMANVLKQLGVGKGDRVVIYLPMIPAAVYAMLACARIGAVHSVVFAGFSAESLGGRIQDCGARLVITADAAWRAGRMLDIKAAVDTAVADVSSVEAVLVVDNGGADRITPTPRDQFYTRLSQQASSHCAPTEMQAEDPLFILYTSGSTGKPKGILHTTGGYMVYAASSFQTVFDYQPADIYWCTADVGWITGHTYGVYGVLANAATAVLFEGVPTYPDASRCWQMIDRHQVTIFYTAPTAIRALMREGDIHLVSSTRQSLRLLGSVGEPINTDAWQWYHDKVGLGQCPIVDTWWQTETGGILISPPPVQGKQKPGAAAKPLFDLQPVLLHTDGTVIEGAGTGNLCLADSWPGQARTIYGDHARFEETYFKAFPGYYFSGDGARRDADGDYWITGRVDDVLNVAGHRLGTAEIETVLDSVAHVVECAVVGVPHAIKGQGIYVFVTLLAGVEATETIRESLIQTVRTRIGAIATPDAIQFCVGLPKTRSGKIMRRILRKIAAGELDSLGDISTLADPSVVDAIIAGRVVV